LDQVGDTVQAVQLLEPLAELDGALLQHLLRPPLAEGPSDEHHQLLRVVWFLYVPIGAQVERFDGRLLRGVAGQDDALGRPGLLPNRPDQVYA
jgi:hypothetical protein